MNIGLVSVFFERGGGYVALQVKDAFVRAGHHVSLLARASETDGQKRLSYHGEFQHNDILLYPTYQINSLDFERWLVRSKIDKVIFIEEHYTRNLVGVCKKLDIPSYNYVVWESINLGDLETYSNFTGIICPVLCTYRMLNSTHLRDNLHYVPWGVDLKKFRYREPVKKDKVNFFFPAGWGGMYERKNEEAVTKAFMEIIPIDKATIRIHTQKAGQENGGHNFLKTSGTISNQDFLNLYAEADCILMPSKWEGNGLPLYESNAIGRPVITVDAPPMNQHIKHNLNGKLCKVKKQEEYPGIYVPAMIADIEDLALQMRDICKDKELLYDMQIWSRRWAEDHFDWEKNGEKLVEVLS